MADDSRLYPLRNIGDVRKVFQAELKKPDPNIALLSIISGWLEHQWTASKESIPNLSSLTKEVSAKDDKKSDENKEKDTTSLTDNPCAISIDPKVEWHLIEALYAKFEGIIKGFCDPVLLKAALESEEKDSEHVRKLIKHVADIIWNTLSKSHYKDRPHLQSIYSYLTGNRLDCFGTALAVVAACQTLGVPHIHLALSEDHAWVVFGQDQIPSTAEVTWHGKGNEDKRGRPVEMTKAKTSWLYLAGKPVVCDRYGEVAAVVSSVNFAINAHLDSVEAAAMQQELLWLLYDQGHLKSYPMALGNLADLEEICPSLGRPKCEKLYAEAVDADRSSYDDHHVYPHTYFAGYFMRAKKYKEALDCWADAASVIQRYRYSKDDEEIYKEFMEIANELIPHVVKACVNDETAAKCVLRNPACYAAILRFYDGLCSWEEGSPTPVLHIGWAKHMVTTCMKFEHDVRKAVVFLDDDNSKEVEGTSTKNQLVNTNSTSSNSVPSISTSTNSTSATTETTTTTTITTPSSKDNKDVPLLALTSSTQNSSSETVVTTATTTTCVQAASTCPSTVISTTSISGPRPMSPPLTPTLKGEDMKEESQLPQTKSQQDCINNVVGGLNDKPNSSSGVGLYAECDETKDEQKGEPSSGVEQSSVLISPCSVHSTSHVKEEQDDLQRDEDEFFDGLLAKCESNLLNPNFLLGKVSLSNNNLFIQEEEKVRAWLSDPERQRRKLAKSARSARRMFKRERRKRARSLLPESKVEKSQTRNLCLSDHETAEPESLKPVKMELKSVKMREMKNLLRAEKLNASAIQLQITAQSQGLTGSPLLAEEAGTTPGGGRPKRSRRE